MFLKHRFDDLFHHQLSAKLVTTLPSSWGLMVSQPCAPPRGGDAMSRHDRRSNTHTSPLFTSKQGSKCIGRNGTLLLATPTICQTQTRMSTCYTSWCRLLNGVTMKIPSSSWRLMVSQPCAPPAGGDALSRNDRRSNNIRFPLFFQQTSVKVYRTERRASSWCVIKELGTAKA